MAEISLYATRVPSDVITPSLSMADNRKYLDEDQTPSGGSTERCTTCGRTFASSKYLNMHRMALHPRCNDVVVLQPEGTTGSVLEARDVRRSIKRHTQRIESPDGTALDFRFSALAATVYECESRRKASPRADCDVTLSNGVEPATPRTANGDICQTEQSRRSKLMSKRSIQGENTHSIHTEVESAELIRTDVVSTQSIRPDVGSRGSLMNRNDQVCLTNVNFGYVMPLQPEDNRERKSRSKRRPAVDSQVHMKSECDLTRDKELTVCPVCEKTLSHKSSLRNHQRTHTGQCMMRYTIMRYIRRMNWADIGSTLQHRLKRTHTGQRPYICVICSIGFKERYHLKKHELYKHSSELREQCLQCGKRFKDSTAVRAHTKIHSDSRPYPCPRCGNSFKTTECLWHHSHRSRPCDVIRGVRCLPIGDVSAGWKGPARENNLVESFGDGLSLLADSATAAAAAAVDTHEQLYGDYFKASNTDVVSPAMTLHMKATDTMTSFNDVHMTFDHVASRSKNARDNFEGDSAGLDMRQSVISSCRRQHHENLELPKTATRSKTGFRLLDDIRDRGSPDLSVCRGKSDMDNETDVMLARSNQHTAPFSERYLSNVGCRIPAEHMIRTSGTCRLPTAVVVPFKRSDLNITSLDDVIVERTVDSTTEGAIGLHLPPFETFRAYTFNSSPRNKHLHKVKVKTEKATIGSFELNPSEFEGVS